jgi:hypothetical protein
MTDHPDNPVQKIWQSQPVEVTKMSTEVLRKRAGKFQRRIWWRNFREYVGAVVGIVLFASFIGKTHEILFRAAYLLYIAGMIWVVVQLHRKASARSMPEAIGNSTCIELLRTEMERQRAVVKNVWRWYLAPLVPGFVVYTVAYALAFRRPASWAGLALLDVIIAAVFFGVWKMNMRAARCLQRKIDELRAVEG